MSADGGRLAAGALGAVLLMAPPLAPGIQDSPAPAFDVVSVKHSGETGMMVSSGDGRSTFLTRWWKYSPGRVTCNLPLSALIQEAYGVKDWQVSGPGWIEKETYDFAATMPEGTTRATARLMIRRMLDERFGLKVRRERREFSIYSLVAGKGGFKLTGVSSPGTYSYRMGRGRYEAKAISLGSFADWLTTVAGRPVFDKTGISGFFDITLEWSPEETAGSSHVLLPDAVVFSALQQVGLKVEPGKAMVEVIVVEHAEREPTAN